MSEVEESKAKLPKHTPVKLVNIYNEEMKGTIIPLSIKATMEVEEEIKIFKRKITADIDETIAENKKAYEISNITDEDIKQDYIESRIATDLLNLNEEVTDAKIKSLTKKKGEKLLEGKEIPVIIEELSIMKVNATTREKLMMKSVASTLWHVLRKTDNLREHLFVSSEVLIDEIDNDALIQLFKEQVEDSNVNEEDLKN